MAPQDRRFKYTGSLTEGPSLTSGCGMACCPWTAYACKERAALREASHGLISVLAAPPSPRRSGGQLPAFNEQRRPRTERGRYLPDHLQR